MKTSHLIEVIESPDDGGYYATVSKLPRCNEVHQTALRASADAARALAIQWVEVQPNFTGFQTEVLYA